MPHATPSVDISESTATFTLIDSDGESPCPISLKYVTYNFHPQFNNVLHRHPDSVYPSGMILPSEICLHPTSILNAVEAGFANGTDTEFVTDETYLEYLDDNLQEYYVAVKFGDLNLRGKSAVHLSELLLTVTDGSVSDDSMKAYVESEFPDAVADLSLSGLSRTTAGEPVNGVRRIDFTKEINDFLKDQSAETVIFDVTLALKITPAGDSLDSRKFASVTHESETGPQLFLQW